MSYKITIQNTDSGLTIERDYSDKLEYWGKEELGKEVEEMIERVSPKRLEEPAKF